MRTSTGRLTLLGVQVDPVTITELNARIAGAIARGERCVVANHNLHSVHLFHRDPAMRALLAQADVIHIDGMPLLLFARLLGHRLRREQRVTYVDWVRPLMSEARDKGWRLFYGEVEKFEVSGSVRDAGVCGGFLGPQGVSDRMVGRLGKVVVRRVD